MKSKSFKGFGVVFRHNLRINMKNVKYVVTTVIVALVLILGFGALVFFVTKSDKDEDKYKYDVKKLYVVDETGLGACDYGMIAPMLGFDYVSDTEFIQSDKDARELIKGEASAYMLVQTKDEELGYVIKIIAGKDIDTKSKQVKKNLSCIEEFSLPCFQNYVYMTSGLTIEQVIQVLLTVDASTEEISEVAEEDEGKFITQVVLTTWIVLVIYFVVAIYGVVICSDVPMEKTSKLVEQLLMSVTPTALISGKILSMITACIIQFVIWFASIFVGIIGGDMFVRSVYDIDTSFVTTAMDFIDKWFAGQGFTAVGIAFAIILFLTGLVVYLILAGLAGATLTKPENAGNVQGVFMLPLVISYFVVLLIIGNNNGDFNIPMVLNFIPFTSAMTAPSCALLGTMSAPLALLSLLESALFCVLELFIAAKVYEGLLFFNGNKLKFKDIIGVFKK